MGKDYTHIGYRDKPFFNVGTPNQWYEQGYFFSKGQYFYYDDDRHDFNYNVELVAESKQDFKRYCETKQIEIPVTFWSKVKRMQ